MEKRGLALSVFLILAAAMFSTNLVTDNSNDLSGMQTFPNTKSAICGNRICDYKYGENMLTCPEDCANNEEEIPIDACRMAVPENSGDFGISGDRLCYRSYGRDHRCILGYVEAGHTTYASTDNTCTGEIMYDKSRSQIVPCNSITKPGYDAKCDLDGSEYRKSFSNVIRFICCPN